MEKSYKAIGRAHAAFIFRAHDEISVPYIRDGIEGTVRLSTRYLERGVGIPVPGDLQAVIEIASAASPEEAITWVTVGQELASLVSISANAAMRDMEGELVYETTKGKMEREHFQRFCPGDEWATSSRCVNMDDTIAFMEAFVNHKERDRLIRAVTQYYLALQHWGMGRELLSITHLFMGVEALKVAYLRKHLEDRKITPEELAVEWGYDPDRGKHGLFLDHECRVKLVFHGDALHHASAKRVSDAFEHGTENGGALFAGAREALVPTARHLRRSIFEVVGLPEELVERLVNIKPRGLGGFEQYFRSTIVGEGDELMVDDLHPSWAWHYAMEEATLEPEKWLYTYRPNTKMTAFLPQGFVFQTGRFEVWDGGQFLPQSASEKLAESQEQGENLG